MDYLAHHGVLGQKWGVRRYQNSDGSLTEEGRYHYRAMKAAKTKDAVDRIYNSMSKHDKYLLGDDEASKEYLTKDEGEYVVKRIMDRVGDTPVAFLDVMTTTKPGELTISVATDPNYRGQGRAAKLVNKSKDWFDKNGSKNGFDYLDYSARVENTASQKVAEKSGFKRVKQDGDWIIFRYDSNMKVRDIP